MLGLTWTEDYQLYLETIWQWASYLPYLLVAYVLLTLLPKSLVRMKRFADADYEANRYRFHRCYGPELCCHVQGAQAQEAPVKQKQRKPVTRVYPKRQQQQPQPAQAKEEAAAPVLTALPPVKGSKVTKIARMFESGGNRRQVSRVAPVTLPQIRMFGASEGSNESTPCASRRSSSSTASQLTAQLQHIEHAMQLWQELEEEQQQQQQQQTQEKPASKLSDWEPRAVAVPAIRRTRGTSATPSTASPLSSSPEPTSPVLLRQPLALCLKSSMEDIFQAIARNAEEPELDSMDYLSSRDLLAPVTSIDDILSQRRFSRPLSAYSITDLLNEEQESMYINETTLQQLQATS